MRIVLSGSSKVKENVFQVAEKLGDKGYEVVVPKEFITDLEKKEASIRHFDEICKDETDILLAVNEPKNGIENYIGPNSFAEIAFAFYFRKDTYVLNDYYEPYLDELEGWKVKALHKNLNNLKR